MSIKAVRPGAFWRYYMRSVAVGDGQRPPRVSLPKAQQAAGSPPGTWAGRALPILGISGEVTERQMQLLFGFGRHPRADDVVTERLAAGDSSAAAGRAVKLGKAPRRTGKDGSRAVLGFDLVFRPPPSLTVLWALGDPVTRAVIEACHEEAWRETLAWIEDNALTVRTGQGRRSRLAARPGVVAAVFRHFDNRHGMPLLHDHVVISVKVQHPVTGVWSNLHGKELFDQAVAAGALYNLRVLELACQRLGLATEPRFPTPGKRPVMDVAGLPEDVITWSGTRQTDTACRLDDFARHYEDHFGHPPAGRARVRLMAQAADQTRPPKKTARALADLLAAWRQQATALFGVGIVGQLLQVARRAAGAIRDAVSPVIDVARAATDVVATVHAHRGEYRISGGFRRRHLLAEARRYLAYTRRGLAAPPDTDERIVEAAIASHCTEAASSHSCRHREHVPLMAAWHLPLPREEHPELRQILDSQNERVATHRARLRLLSALAAGTPDGAQEQLARRLAPRQQPVQPSPGGQQARPGRSRR